ncbi:MAG: hypothetical protein ACTSRW_03530 [Candidatus Helarchaeota archaeon]
MEWWAKKYEPRSLRNIIDHESVINRFKEYLAKKNFPHLIISGPNGSGRLTATSCLLRDLYGAEYINNTMLLNAFDPKDYLVESHPSWFDQAKIDKKRRLGHSAEPNRMELLLSIIRNFPKLRSLSEIPFRTLILYDADGLNRGTQQALRRVLETSTHTFRLMIICNNISRIIAPIRSRCVSFNFGPFREDSMLKILRHVTIHENITISEDALKILVRGPNKNLTQNINLLQAAVALQKPITPDLILKLSKRIFPTLLMKELIYSLMRGNFIQAREKMRDLLKKHRISGRAFLMHFQDAFMNQPIPEKWRARFSLLVADVDHDLLTGNTEDIQLTVLLARFAKVFQEELKIGGT